jgi:hypothetical protein
MQSAVCHMLKCVPFEILEQYIIYTSHKKRCGLGSLGHRAHSERRKALVHVILMIYNPYNTRPLLSRRISFHVYPLAGLPLHFAAYTTIFSRKSRKFLCSLGFSRHGPDTALILLDPEYKIDLRATA